MKNRFIQTVDNFTPQARPLRNHYDANFKNPLEATSARFAWDYWHVPDQYTLIRTPASTYFPKNIFSKFISELTEWGQNNLGCRSISPPWLSYYVEGCEQKLHCDIPHGPWAFVYSLTAGRLFKGGETLIIKPEHLNYWKDFSTQRGLEQIDLLHRISPKFNRLTVFDPRLPHGVTRVSGTHDPREARLVIHGWFTHPQPIIRGSVTPKNVQDNLSHLLGDLEKTLSEISPVTGTQCHQLDITASGRVSKIKVLSNTLVSREGRDDHVRALTKWLQLQMLSFRFKRSNKPSRITLPLIFE